MARSRSRAGLSLTISSSMRISPEVGSCTATTLPQDFTRLRSETVAIPLTQEVGIERRLDPGAASLFDPQHAVPRRHGGDRSPAVRQRDGADDVAHLRLAVRAKLQRRRDALRRQRIVSDRGGVAVEGPGAALL